VAACVSAYAATTMMNLWYFLNIFNISNIDKEINKKLSEDDLLEDRNMLECFLKCFKWL
jgi:ferritin-like protein